MRHLMLVAALASISACHGNDPAKGSTGSAAAARTTPQAPDPIAPPAPPARTGSNTAVVAEAKPAVVDDKPAAKQPVPALEGHDFTQTGRELFAIGACGEVATPEGYSAQMIQKHCKIIRAAQEDYANRWVKLARPFFAEKVPANVPKRVVYPFAGGDLSTALTVYPDADEITTMSLEPAGDPRTLDALNRAANANVAKSAKPSAPRSSGALDRALGTVEKELRFLYRVNFSNTLNMIDAMRGGSLPTQLIFGLSALKVHGYELVSLRYFKLDDAGVIQYLTDDEVAAAPDAMSEQKEKRNRIFANAEVRFQKPGGRVQIYRHIQQNLDNDHLKTDPRVLKHLEAKGTVAAMTKAASYLLSWESFSTMRDYLMGHVTWMVSDATGIAPKWGKAAGFQYETYGGFTEPHIPAGNDIARSWRGEFEAQPKRELKFRFGYYDKRIVDHLIIMKKP
jgi:hypothetical protein